jgi:hypothetical protein
MSLLWLSTLLALSLVNAAAPWSCKPVPAHQDYSYCVSLPLNIKSASKWPLLIYLSGSEANADLAHAPDASTLSGTGYVLAQHKAGNTSAHGALMEKEFITLFVIASCSAQGIIDFADISSGSR